MCLVLAILVGAGWQRTDGDGPAMGTPDIRERGRGEVERSARTTSERVKGAGLCQQELFVEMNHGNNDIMYASHDAAQTFMSVKTPISNVDEVGPILEVAFLRACVRYPVSRGFFAGAHPGFNVLFFRMALDFGKAK